MNTLRSLVVSSIRSTTKARGFLCCHKSTNAHSPPLTRGGAGCCWSSTSSTRLCSSSWCRRRCTTQSRQQHQSDTSPVWPEALQPPEIPPPPHPLLTGQKLSAKQKLSKRWALADCSHHCCLPACLPASLGLHYGCSSPPSPYVVLGRATWLRRYSWPNSGSICKQTQFCFGRKNHARFREEKDVLPLSLC